MIKLVVVKGEPIRKEYRIYDSLAQLFVIALTTNSILYFFFSWYPILSSLILLIFSGISPTLFWELAKSKEMVNTIIPLFSWNSIQFTFRPPSSILVQKVTFSWVEYRVVRGWLPPSTPVLLMEPWKRLSLIIKPWVCGTGRFVNFNYLQIYNHGFFVNKS